jgi:hypothetical protein
MGFVRDINQNSKDSHQVSPGYVLTILRWSNRSTFNYDNEDPLDVRNPLTVYNDAINVSVTNTKSGLTPSMVAVLKGGDINYATAVHPGDYILVNMLNWETDAERVRNTALKLQPINKYGDGFKGVFKIQSVRKNITMNGDKKTLTYTIHAAGFTEFNNVIYFNPAIAAAFREAGTIMYSTLVGEYYQKKLKTNSEIQEIMKDLFEILIGKSRRSDNVMVKNFGEVNFRVPKTLGRLLGRDMNSASELFTYYVGVWGNSRSSAATTNNIGELFNPSMTLSRKPGIYDAKTSLQGNKEIFIENWNNKTAWSILQNNMNKTLNEMYTTYRLDPNNRVMPTVILRQKPFTTPHFDPPSGYPVTRYFDLPRWRISPTLLYSLDLGKDEAARMNFVQVYTRTLPDTFDQDMVEQITSENFVLDQGDINRHGLRPYVVTSNFDFPIKTNKKLRAKPWSQIVSDWVIDGHLKESGTMKFQGIQDPISVGDNIELDNVIYHIESVKHTMTVTPAGMKSFKTSISVSYGMDIRSNRSRPVYPEMEHTDAHTKNIEDYDNDRLRPGISDTQDIGGRPQSGPTAGEEVRETPQKSFTLNPRRRKKTKTNSSSDGSSKKPDKDDGGK